MADFEAPVGDFVVDVIWVFVCLSFLYCLIRKWAHRHRMLARTRPDLGARPAPDEQTERPLVSAIVVNSENIGRTIDWLEHWLPDGFDVIAFSCEARATTVPDPGCLGARIVAGIRRSCGKFVVVVDPCSLPDVEAGAFKWQERNRVWAAVDSNFLVMSREMAMIAAANMHMEEHGAVFEVVTIAQCVGCHVETIPGAPRTRDFREMFTRLMLFCAYHLDLWWIVPR